MLDKITYDGARALLEITSKCNYNCKYCYCLWHEKGYHIDEELPAEQWLEVLNILKSRGIESVMLTGGEPMLKDGFWRILDKAVGLFGAENVSFYSNASLINQKHLVRIKELGVSFSTSLQGLSTHEQITGYKDGVVHTLQVIERARDMGISVACGCTVTALNKHEFTDIVSAASYAGATVQCSVLLMGGRARKNKYLSVTPQEWASIKEEIKALPIPHIFCDEFECTCNKQMESENCTAGKTYFVVDPFGNVRKCLHSSFIFGNVFNLKKTK